MAGKGLIAVTAVLLLVALGAAPASAREPNPRCYPRQYDNYEYGASGRVRVYDVLKSDAEDLQSEDVAYVCDLVTGRRVEIGRSSVDDPWHPDTLRFAGPVVGFRAVDCFKQYCDYSIRTVDLRTGRKLTGGYVGDPIYDLVLAPTGSAAWMSLLIGPPRPGVHLKKMTAAGSQDLDVGPGIEPGSLALSAGSLLYWTKDGAVRTTMLDEAAPRRDPRPDPAFGGSRRCYPRGSVTLAGGSRARVYRARDGDRRDLVACDLRSGRRVRFAFYTPPDATYTLGPVRFAGRFVALSVRSCSLDCTTSVVVIDLDRGRARTAGSTGSAPHATDLVLAKDGAVGWIVEDEVWRCPASGTCDGRIDLGRFARPRSLALSRGGRLYWTMPDGTPRMVEATK